ncbi:MAG: ATP-binding protein [Tannerellaceae bacterium]|jgi:predicted ATPase|nr:ATP-binding protein [Tannerellaceae bacterium]
MNKAHIKLFEVFDLFGTDNVSIPLDDGVKILIGENGLGKTQILNLFYYMLTGNFLRLSEFNFSKLKLSFTDETNVEIPKSEIQKMIDDIYQSPVIKDFIKEYGLSQFEIVRNKLLNNKNWQNDRVYKNYPYSMMHRLLREMEEIGSNSLFSKESQIKEIRKKIEEELCGAEILYFPTYRRVEEDLFHIGYDEEDLAICQENNLVQFGMDDVKKRFKIKENVIDRLLKEGLNQFTKDILNVVLDDSQPEKGILDKIDASDVDIILSRVGNSLPESQKEAVKDIVAKREIKNPLSIYLLQKLTDIYEKQKEHDKSIKKFRDACNTYLIGKEVFYDESEIKIYVKSKRANDEIDLKYLSSGEKQIISIFSKVYLSDLDKRFYILFDEPELSLSLIWQKQLLPDILNSNKCDFLLAVTHSPFIFDNDLDKHAVGLSEYVKPLNGVHDVY